MARHFPEGHEIVRAEEVVEGQRVLDKSRKSEIETDPAISALNQKINFGKLAQTTSTQQKDSLPILESRIIYRRKAAQGPKGANGFSAVATMIPEFYLDPNEMARCRERIELAEMKKPKPVTMAEKPKDSEAKQASAAPAEETSPGPDQVQESAPSRPKGRRRRQGGQVDRHGRVADAPVVAQGNHGRDDSRPPNVEPPTCRGPRA